MLSSVWRTWEIGAIQRWPLCQKNSQLRKTLHSLKQHVSGMQVAHDTLKSKEVQQRGKILELTVQRRDLITRHSAEKKQLAADAELLVAQAKIHVRKEHRREIVQWEEQSRAWSAERSRLKREIDECAAAAALACAQKSSAMRDVEVALSKQRRFAGKARKFRDIARNIQETSDIDTQARRDDVDNVRAELQKWREAAEERANAMDAALASALAKQDTYKRQMEGVRKAELEGRMRHGARLVRLRRRLRMFRCFAYWMKLCEAQKIGTRIAMGARQQAQRQSMRAAYAMKQAEKKTESANKALEALRKAADLERVQYTTEMGKLNEELDMQIVTLARDRDSLLHAHAEAAEAAQRRDEDARAEIQALSKEVEDLREKAIVSDANKLTAIVLEEEVVTLRVRLDASKAEVAQKEAELRAVSQGINLLLVTPQLGLPRGSEWEEHAAEVAQTPLAAKKEADMESPSQNTPRTMRKSGWEEAGFEAKKVEAEEEEEDVVVDGEGVCLE